MRPSWLFDTNIVFAVPPSMACVLLALRTFSGCGPTNGDSKPINSVAKIITHYVPTIQHSSQLLVLPIKLGMKKHFNVFPNPNNGIFSINTTSNFDKIEIFNLVGQKIFTFNNEDLNHINLSKEPTGIYFVKVSFENSIITKRIIYN